MERSKRKPVFTAQETPDAVALDAKQPMNDFKKEK
jgi:hypothetical protein